MVNVIKVVLGASLTALGIALLAEWAVVASGLGERGAVVLAAGFLVEVPVVLIVLIALGRAAHNDRAGGRTR